jgi:hypothetical protein
MCEVMEAAVLPIPPISVNTLPASLSKFAIPFIQSGKKVLISISLKIISGINCS